MGKMSQFKRSPKEQTRILIVDDQPDNAKLLSIILALHGYEVVECNRGKLAVDLATKNPPDLILLDVGMPEMNGFEVCQLLKSDRRTENIPIIFISAFQEVKEKTQAFNLGGNDYITKPFQMEEVIARVETQLKYYRLQTELKIKNQQLKQEIEARQASEAKLLKINQQLSKLAIIDSLTNIAIPIQMSSMNFNSLATIEEGVNQGWSRGPLQDANVHHQNQQNILRLKI